MTEPTTQLDERFSSPGAAARPWAEVVEAIERAEIFWLSTTRRDGRPHVTPLPAIWHEGALHFCTGPEEQKARNLAANPACALTTGSDRFLSGLDVVVEGTATRVTDRPTLEALAALWRAQLDWPYDVVEDGFRDPSVAGAAGDEPGAGAPAIGSEPPADSPATALVFAVAPTKVLAFGKGEPFSQTRYRFD